MKTIDITSTSRSVILLTDNLFSDISLASVFVDDNPITNTNPGNTTTIWYQLLEDTEVRGRAAIRINNLNSQTCYVFSATTYTDPGIEFWKYDFEPAAVDTSLSGGVWAGGVKTNALGFSSTDIIVDGDTFISPNAMFAPEELVPGHTSDSLGINVFTKDPETYATVVSGSFPVKKNKVTTATVSIIETASAGIMVYFNGQTFDRSTTTNFTSSSQFFVQGKNIILPPQSSNGRAGYTMVKIGGHGLVDSQVAVMNTTSNHVIITSLISYADVRAVYVLSNGKEVNQISTVTDSGYMVLPDWDDNNRASVHLYNIPGLINTVEAWFFDTPYVRFNRMHEEFFTVTTPQQNFILTNPPGTWEPYSDKALVEKALSSTSNERLRQEPPYVSNYTKTNNQLRYRIDNRQTYASNYFTADSVHVYANGTKLRSGYDFNFDLPDNSIVLINNIYPDGTKISITSTQFDHDYIILGNVLKFNTTISSTNVKVTTFNNHDTMFMETEKFYWNMARRFTLLRPILDDNYVWVYLNGKPLIHRFDFEILEDMRTIQLSSDIETAPDSEILITSILQPETANKVYGYRIFNDMFDRTHYKRLSAFHSTFLTQDVTFTDNSIPVYEEHRLSPMNATKNIPGVALIDRERVEFFGRDGDSLSQLRRGTLGTGPAWYLDRNTKVIDQGILQTIPGAFDTVYNWTTVTSTASSYTIIGFTSTNFANFGFTGVNLDPNVEPEDQVQVYYGGSQLSKSSKYIYESVTSTSATLDPYEFYINTVTNSLVLNTAAYRFRKSGGIEPGTALLVMQKKGQIWTGTESILTSQVKQAKFIREKEADLPDVYFYGGDPRLQDANYVPLEDENGNSLTRW